MNWLLDIAAAFDLVITILLVITIVYAFVLNRKLNILRAARGDMDRFVADFSTAVDRAGEGMKEIKERAAESGEALARRVETADRLADDLALLEKRADLAAHRLETLIAQARDDVPSSSTSRKAPGAKARRFSGIAERPASESARPVNPKVVVRKNAGDDASMKQEPVSEEQSQIMKVLQGMR